MDGACREGVKKNFLGDMSPIRAGDRPPSCIKGDFYQTKWQKKKLIFIDTLPYKMHLCIFYDVEEEVYPLLGLIIYDNSSDDDSFNA